MEKILNKIIQDLTDSLKYWDIHEVCFYCRNPKKCKQKYSRWSGNMPSNIFCGDYKE